MDGASHSTSAVEWIDLNSAQLPVWLDLQNGTDPRSYVIGGYLRIAGAIDPERLRRALALAIADNDALRLRVDADHPRQAFHAELLPPLDVLDISAAADPEAAFRTYIVRTFARPFDMAGGALFHFVLAKGGERQWFLLIRYHHLIIDGMGISLMIRAVAEAYATLSGAVTERTVGAIPYSRFAAEDDAYRRSQRRERDLAYWRERLLPLPDSIFPPRFPSPALHEPSSPSPESSVKLWIERPRYHAFLETCRARGASPFPVFLALLGALVGRMGARDELVIGVPVLNRATAELKRGIGMMAGMMPFKLRLDGATTLAALVDEIGDRLRGDYRHQRAAIHDIHHALALAHGERRLFDVALSYEKNDYDFPIGDAYFQLIGLTGGHEPNPLALYVREYHRDKPVLVEFAFNAAHLTRAEVEMLAQRFARFFAAYLAGDDERVDALPVLSADERQQVLTAWSAPARSLPATSVVALVEAQAAAHPGAIAVSMGERALSYGDLAVRVAAL
ncbi:MAG TPA: condensation domain-containing protein, partial [Stellaceae bacterium]|nr:condensation domain-containing protein [Stellaceae bacterium]